MKYSREREEERETDRKRDRERDGKGHKTRETRGNKIMKYRERERESGGDNREGHEVIK
jgi:hypothetical protein